MSATNPHKFYEQLLFAPALTYAVSQGYYFGTDCEHNFRIAIRKAVDLLIAENLIEDEESIRKAQAGFVEVVVLMIAKVKPQNKWKRLRESSLREVLKKFCPRFPFC